MSQIGFMKAMLDYFGLLPGQTIMQCGAEIKALSAADKQEFANSLRALGINCADPILAKAAA